MLPQENPQDNSTGFPQKNLNKRDWQLWKWGFGLKIANCWLG